MDEKIRELLEHAASDEATVWDRACNLIMAEGLIVARGEYRQWTGYEEPGSVEPCAEEYDRPEWGELYDRAHHALFMACFPGRPRR